MGNCQERAESPLSLTVDLSQIDSQQSVLALVVEPQQSSRDLFNLIRNQLPRNAPSLCFQFALHNRKIEITEKSLRALKVKDGDRLVLELKDAMTMTQMTVLVEGTGAKFTFWVGREATVKSVLALISKTLRVPVAGLRLTSGSVELSDSSAFDHLSSPLELKLKMDGDAYAQQPAKAPSGMTLEIVCEETTCLKYLQRQIVEMGVGTFEYCQHRKNQEVKCADCGKSSCSIEAMRFRDCTVKFEGQKDDGSDTSGCESFTHISGELLKGLRWRRLRLDVCPV